MIHEKMRGKFNEFLLRNKNSLKQFFLNCISQEFYDSKLRRDFYCFEVEFFISFFFKLLWKILRWKAKINYIARFSQLMQEFAFFHLSLLNNKQTATKLCALKVSRFSALERWFEEDKNSIFTRKKIQKLCRLLHED